MATRVAVRDYNPKFCGVAGEGGYVNYFRAQWAAKIRFINVEHDVVPWPGSLEKLWFCPQPWCAYGYHPHEVFANPVLSLFPYLGCVKFSEQFIAATPTMWEDVTETWETLDRHVAARAREYGLKVHQHYPAVLNANPVLLGKEVSIP